MKQFFRRIAAVALLSGATTIAWADSSAGVRINKIKFVGLSRIDSSTAKTYLPVHVGSRLNQASSVDIIKSLYDTGFFSNIRVNRQGHTLLIHVNERPTIGRITFSGNKNIPNKSLLKALHANGIDDGRVYKPVDLHMITEGLKQQYAMMGYHDVIVDADVVPEPRNRVSIDIKINEGGVAKVRSIEFVGNHAFSARTLRSHMDLSTAGIFSWFTKSDQFSEQKLEQSLRQLSDFYFNHGYLRFSVLSHDVKMSKDKRSVNIIVHVYEGKPYNISGHKLDNQSKLSSKKIASLIDLEKGQRFSREQILSINNKIGDLFADQGFAFPSIQAVPRIDDASHTVFVTYVIKPGRRIYVRNIDFFGNERTADSVLRRQTIQLEGALYSETRVKESKRRLANLSYLNNIEVSTSRVPNKPNEVDLHYRVHEVNAGRATLMAGYSDVDGFLYGLNVSEPNFMGSGKSVSLGLTRSSYSDNYNFSYYNPYYTINNVGRGFNLYYTHATPGSSINTASYIMNGFGGALNYNIPLTEYSTISFGLGYDRIDIRTGGNTADEIQAFVNRYGTQYNQFKGLAGWSYSNYDRYVFPNEGFGNRMNLEVGLPVMRSSLDYYKLTYHASWYYPITRDNHFILNVHTNLGYGNGYGDVDELPFFNNFFAGGIDTVPGFEPNTLGPKDQFNNGLGGNLELVGGVNLIFPNHISNKLRTALTFDAGNIYNTSRSAIEGTGSSDTSGPLRYSAGIEVSWYSPLGPLRFSIAKVLNKQQGDQLSLFNFSFGASL